MSRQKIPLLSLAVVATAAITANRFVAPTGVHATAAGRALGVATEDAAIGDAVAVDVIGTTTVEASAAIAAGAQIEVAANGKAATLDAGVAVGRALEAAGADGDMIEVLLIVN